MNAVTELLPKQPKQLHLADTAGPDTIRRALSACYERPLDPTDLT